MESIVLVLARASKAPRIRPPDGRGQPPVEIRAPEECADAEALTGISRMLRSMSLPAKLEHCREPERQASAEANGQAVEMTHPDAQAVLAACREQHPQWVHLTASGIWRVYCAVLRERCHLRIEEFLRALPWETAKPVLAAINALKPRAVDDDPYKCWSVLVWYHPERAKFEYTDREIHCAWNEVITIRRRLEKLGSAMGLRKVKSIWTRALRKLVQKFGLKKLVLLDLPLAAFNSIEGTLTVKSPDSRSTEYHLSKCCQVAMDKWIGIRGPRDGALFCEPPAEADQHQVPVTSDRLPFSFPMSGHWCADSPTRLTSRGKDFSGGVLNDSSAESSA